MIFYVAAIFSTAIAYWKYSNGETGEVEYAYYISSTIVVALLHHGVSMVAFVPEIFTGTKVATSIILTTIAKVWQCVINSSDEFHHHLAPHTVMMVTCWAVPMYLMMTCSIEFVLSLIYKLQRYQKKSFYKTDYLNNDIDRHAADDEVDSRHVHMAATPSSYTNLSADYCIDNKNQQPRRTRGSKHDEDDEVEGGADNASDCSVEFEKQDERNMEEPTAPETTWYYKKHYSYGDTIAILEMVANIAAALELLVWFESTLLSHSCESTLTSRLRVLIGLTVFTLIQLIPFAIFLETSVYETEQIFLTLEIKNESRKKLIHALLPEHLANDVLNNKLSLASLSHAHSLAFYKQSGTH
jgi:hypothetical protein